MGMDEGRKQRDKPLTRCFLAGKLNSSNKGYMNKTGERKENMTDETRDLIVINNGAVQTHTHNPVLELAIRAWLDSKANKSGSERTARIYKDYITGFRSKLQEWGHDLDSLPEIVAPAAQDWCGREQASASTFNQRKAVLSSFYTFSRKQGFLGSNPIERVEGRSNQEYRSARPLNKEAVGKALFEIKRHTIAGARDYALLSILLTTGRRVNELVNLQVGDLSREGDALTIIWRRTKGNKTAQDEIQPHIARVLIRYLEDWYQTPFAQIAEKYHADAPVFVSLGNRDKGKPLTAKGVSLICEKHLGTSKVHSTRHTFAHAMSEVGAKPEEIQARLGHSSLAITGRYLAALNSAKNAHAGKVASMFGIEE
jgi:integrase